MKHFSRPYRIPGILVLAGIAVGAAIAPQAASAQVRQLVQWVQEPSPLLLHSNSQGYLGVDLADVDSDKAQALKLKEVRGAVITLIDHDAPAGKIGLKANDVVLELNGQNVEGAEQLRRMLKEIPAGRKVNILISRDGNQQTITVELADRRAMEHDVWNKIGNDGDVFAQAPSMGILADGNGSIPGGFHMPFFGSSLNVGALVEPLTSQMADYLGVPSGLMVKQVARKSEAAAAGLKAFDVILKVGTEAIKTTADWDRSLRASQGKTVQVTILRDKKQQTLTLVVDSKHHSAVVFENIYPNDCPQVAVIDPEFAQNFIWNDGEGMQVMPDRLGPVQPIDPKQVEELRKQAEKLRQGFKSGEFKLDPRQMDELKKQMEEMRKNLKPEEFKFNMQQMNIPPMRFMIIRPFPPSLEEQQREQMNDLKQQMEEMKELGFGDHI